MFNRSPTPGASPSAVEAFPLGRRRTVRAIALAFVVTPCCTRAAGAWARTTRPLFEPTDLELLGLLGFVAGSDRYGVLVGVSPKFHLFGRAAAN